MSTSRNVTDAGSGGDDVGRSVLEKKNSVNLEDRATEGNEVERVVERQKGCLSMWILVIARGSSL